MQDEMEAGKRGKTNPVVKKVLINEARKNVQIWWPPGTEASGKLSRDLRQLLAVPERLRPVHRGSDDDLEVRPGLTQPRIEINNPNSMETGKNDGVRGQQRPLAEQ